MVRLVVKTRLYGTDTDAAQTVQYVLCCVLTELLKLLHPFMPFLTEEIYQALPHDTPFLMTSRWPEYREEYRFPEDEEAMEAVTDTIRAIRTRRAEMGVPPSRRAEILLVTRTPDIYRAGLGFFERLAYADGVRFGEFRRLSQCNGIYADQ